MVVAVVWTASSVHQPQQLWIHPCSEVESLSSCSLLEQLIAAGEYPLQTGETMYRLRLSFSWYYSFCWTRSRIICTSYLLFCFTASGRCMWTMIKWIWKKLYSISHIRERIVQNYLIKYQWCLYPAVLLYVPYVYLTFFKSSVVLIERYADMKTGAYTFLVSYPQRIDW